MRLNETFAGRSVVFLEWLPMDTLWAEMRSWAVVAAILVRYGLYRVGLGKCPTFKNNLYAPMLVVGRVMKWHKRLRIVGADQCPKQHPAVFCANHVKKDDPFVVEAAIHLASAKTIWVDQMMRDDFFGETHKTWLYDPNELMIMLGANLISRSKVTWSQLKVFVELLRNNQSFLMFPGRSRSRSGLVMEYREDIAEPGSAAFFVAHAQRLAPDQRIPLVPVARTYNPVTRKTAVVFGSPLFLDDGADRGQQRALDFRVIEAIAGLIEVHVPHVVCAILFMRCLHARTGPMSIARLHDDILKILEKVPERHVDPAARGSLDSELEATLKYLQTKGAVELRDREVWPKSETILASPPVDAAYRDKAPVRFVVNQIVHLTDLVRAVEEAVLT